MGQCTVAAAHQSKNWSSPVDGKKKSTESVKMEDEAQNLQVEIEKLRQKLASKTAELKTLMGKVCGRLHTTKLLPNLPIHCHSLCKSSINVCRNLSKN